MKILYGYRNLKNTLKDSVVCIGIFDGIHVGHKKVIKKVLSSGKNEKKVVITFDPHPLTTLKPNSTPPRIMSLEHRLMILEGMGIDAVIVIRFTESIAKMSPEDFIKKVLNSIGAKKVYVGDNFYFGKRKSGDIHSFIELGKKNGIDVRSVKPVKVGRRIVSSTWLRDLILKGNIKKAENLLRRPVSVFGTVVKGDKRGRELNVPTANIDPHQETLPPPGVYAVKVDVANIIFDGVLNIGFKPTFYGRREHKRMEPTIEVHILGFEGDLYSKNVEIFFVKKLRKEKRFRSEAKLLTRINKDIEKSLKILSDKEIVRKIKFYKKTCE